MQQVLEPRAEYQARLEARRSAAERSDHIHRRLGNWRLAVAAAVAVLAWTSFARGAISRWWVLAPVPVFIALAAAHDRVLRRRALAERAADSYERGLARLEHRWMGAGESGERYRDPAHPYGEDLDLFGKGSVFELLCRARTRMGEDTLAAWLLAPAPPEIVLARQQAVAELRPRLDLRESLAVLAGDVRSDVHPEALAAWGEAPPLLPAGWWRRAGHFLLAGLGLAGLVFWFVTGIITPLIVVLLADALLLLGIRKRVDARDARRGIGRARPRPAGRCAARRRAGAVRFAPLERHARRARYRRLAALAPHRPLAAPDGAARFARIT